MQLLDIIITVCLLSTPDKCDTIRIEVPEEYYMTPYQCIMRAQMNIAEYMKDKPQYFIKRFDCSRKSKDT